jgi:hypothetical protein
MAVVFAVCLLIPTLAMSWHDGDGNNNNNNYNQNSNTNSNYNNNQNNNVNQNTNTNQNTNFNSNHAVAVGGSVNIENEKQMLNTPLAIPNIIPDLQYGDIKTVTPFITDPRLKQWNGEYIIQVVSKCKAKGYDIIEKTIELVNDANQKEDLTKCRIMVRKYPSTKMWTTGGSMTVGGSGFVGSGGMSGALGILPSYGRMTADDVYDMFILRVVN